MRTLTRALGLQLVAGMICAGASAAPVIDNERVTVNGVVLMPGQSAPATPHDLDTVIMFLEGGKIRTTGANGKSRTATRQFGDAVFVPKGTDAVDTLVSGGQGQEGSAHEIVIALKDHAEPLTPNPTKYPLAFPRPGSVKVLDNKRVVVWHYTWAKDKPTPMHFHDKDVVVAYRYDGALKSTPPDGQATVNSFKAGEIRFNKGNRSHSELLASDRESAVIMELK